MVRYAGKSIFWTIDRHTTVTALRCISKPNLIQGPYKTVTVCISKCTACHTLITVQLLPSRRNSPKGTSWPPTWILWSRNAWWSCQRVRAAHRRVWSWWKCVLRSGHPWLVWWVFETLLVSSKWTCKTWACDHRDGLADERKKTKRRRGTEKKNKNNYKI